MSKTEDEMVGVGKQIIELCEAEGLTYGEMDQVMTYVGMVLQKRMYESPMTQRFDA